MQKETLILILALLLASSSAAQPVKIKSGEMKPVRENGDFSVQEAGERIHTVIQFTEIPGNNTRKEIRDSGARLLGYIPENSWYASVKSDRVGKIRTIEKVSEVYRLSAENRISPELPGNTEKKKINVTVEFFRDVGATEKNLILGKHAEKVHGNIITVSPGKIDQLASEDHVKWIRSPSPPPTTLNNASRDLIEVDQLHSNPYSLKGEGFTAAEWDGGWAGDHEDLNYTEKLIIGDLGGLCGGCTVKDHGTHVAGTMLGNGTGDLTYKGMAPDARLVTYEWPDSESELEDETNESINEYSSVLSQNSWGWNIGGILGYDASKMGNYEGMAPDYDNIIHGNSTDVEGTLSVIFSAGNEGNDHSFRYNTTLGPGGTAKNTITVGAVDDSGSMTYYSSWGPTDDGRIKPTVVADGGDCNPGTSINSTLPGNTYGEKCGTSMAAPAVSGAVILMNEAFNDSYSRKPEPATLKGLLIQNAGDLNRTGPDYITGWGLVNTTEAVDYIQESRETDRIRTGKIGNGENTSYSYSLTGNSANITLVWSDYPGEVSAAKALVNDLDLIVTNSTGYRFHPWTLNWSGRKQQAQRTGSDHTNTVEQVFIPYSTGEINITVEGDSVPYPDQNFTLTVDTTMKEARKPEVLVESPGNQTYTSTSIDFNFTTDEKLKYGNFSLDAGKNISMDNDSKKHYFNTSHYVGNGFHNVTFYARDLSDNTGANTTYFSVDTVAPSLEIQKPENRTYSSGTVDLNFTINDSSGETWYILDGARKKFVSGNTTVNTSSEGIHNLTLAVNDSVDNRRSKSVFFTTDTGPPNITFNSPSSTNYSSRSVEINVTATDSTGVSSVTSEVNHTVNLTLVNSSGFWINKSYSYAEGSNNVTLYVNDSVGNTNTSETVEFNVDTSPPVINITSPENTNYSSKFIWFNATTGEKLLNSSWKLDAKKLSGVKNSSQKFYIRENVTEDSHNASFEAFDWAGNFNSSTVNFTVSIDPVIEHFQVENPNVLKGEKVNLTANITEHSYGNVSLNLTLPNGTFLTRYPENTTPLSGNEVEWRKSLAETSLKGSYSAKLKVNDTMGNEANDTVKFNVSEQVEVNSNASNGKKKVNLSWKIKYPENRKLRAKENSSKANFTLPKGSWTIELSESGIKNSSTIELKETKLNRNLSLDTSWEQDFSASSSGFDIKDTLAAGIGFNFSSATVKIPYSGTLSNRKALKCSAWNFTEDSCQSGWQEMSSNASFTGGKLEINASSFSAYAAAEEKTSSNDDGSSGGGGGGSSGGGGLTGVSTKDTSPTISSREDFLEISGLEIEENGSYAFNRSELDELESIESIELFGSRKLENGRFQIEVRRNGSMTRNYRSFDIKMNDSVKVFIEFSAPENWSQKQLRLENGSLESGRKNSTHLLHLFTASTTGSYTAGLNEVCHQVSAVREVCRNFSCGAPEGWTRVDSCTEWQTEKQLENRIENLTSMDTGPKVEGLLDSAREELSEGNYSGARNLVERASDRYRERKKLESIFRLIVTIAVVFVILLAVAQVIIRKNR